MFLYVYTGSGHGHRCRQWGGGGWGGRYLPHTDSRSASGNQWAVTSFLLWHTVLQHTHSPSICLQLAEKKHTVHAQLSSGCYKASDWPCMFSAYSMATKGNQDKKKKNEWQYTYSMACISGGEGGLRTLSLSTESTFIGYDRKALRHKITYYKNNKCTHFSG